MVYQELHEELAKAFTREGILAKEVNGIKYFEKEYGIFIDDTFNGHNLLSLSFQEFYIETIVAAAPNWAPRSTIPLPPTYSDTARWLLANFRNLRAIDILFHSGYPLDGFALLRHLKESSLYLGGMLSGLTTYSKLHGLDILPNPSKILSREDMERIRKARVTPII